MEKCFICKDLNATVQSLAGQDSHKVKCPYCGDFSISNSAVAVLSNSPISLEQRKNVRGWLRENQNVRVSSSDIEMLRNLESPTVAERSKKLLGALSKAGRSIGYIFEIPPHFSARWEACSWSGTYDELRYLLLTYMAETKGWLINASPASGLKVQISPNGYDYLESLRLGGDERKSGFCAMWFSSEVTPIWTDAIKPAIEAAGYNAIRLDGVEHNNKIDDEILANIRASRFVVADFTGDRGGVYFEAGFAMGLGRPVIWTVKEDDLSKVHFDNRQYNFIVWKPEELAEFAKRLQLRIEATIGRGPIRFQS